MGWSKTQAANRKKKLQKRRELGLCTNGGTQVNGSSLCSRCREKKNERQRAVRLKRKKDGLCPSCGKPLAEGLNRCQKCYERKKIANERYREKRKKE